MEETTEQERQEFIEFIQQAEANITLSISGDNVSMKIDGGAGEIGMLLYLACERDQEFKNLLILTAEYYKEQEANN